MKRLTADQIARKASLVEQLRAARNDVDIAIDVFNEEIREAWKRLEKARSDYNGVLDQAADLAREVESDLENYAAEKSDKWNDSPAGQAHAAWFEEWGSVNHDGDFQVLELDAPDELPPLEGSAADALEALPEERP